MAKRHACRSGGGLCSTCVLIHGDGGGHAVELLVQLALDLHQLAAALRVGGEHACGKEEEADFSACK
jgi:hypothetical protein